ncbi:hypothetical protein T10_4758 [Trichinella papuae]|uniref:Uncharacterized protein n=1 Tax=Trichinella papuae TaxID=268474 RepID=A0A0V1MN20_9BILA|nr:hypothetical protein T10_4758 [Trichinella papuae]
MITTAQENDIGGQQRASIDHTRAGGIADWSIQLADRRLYQYTQCSRWRKWCVVSRFSPISI